jgi:hypothetical protein
MLGVDHAVEWSGGSVIDLGGLPSSTGSAAGSINDVGQVVGVSLFGGVEVATEWSGGSVIDLGGLPKHERCRYDPITISFKLKMSRNSGAPPCPLRGQPEDDVAAAQNLRRALLTPLHGSEKGGP